MKTAQNSNRNTATQAEGNPLLNRGKLPAFDRIAPAHFLPAIEAALADVEKKREALRADKAEPSFQNTVVPLEGLFDEIRTVMRLLGNYTANTYTKELAAIEEQADLKVSAVSKNVYQDAVLGARFRAVYDKRSQLTLDDDDLAVLKQVHQSFEESGALLDAAGQKKIRALDEKLITLAQKFRDNMQAAPDQQAILITDEKELAGLSLEDIGGFAENARKHGYANGWLVTPERLMVDELLERAENAGFRKKLHVTLNNLGRQAPLDNRPLIQEMQRLRHDFARLLGYDTYAAFARSRAMQTDLPAVRGFLKTVAERALPKFEADMRALEEFSKKNGGPATLEPWDVSYWAQRQRQALYKFDVNGFARYLELENVMRGMFAEASHLFGLSFAETKAHPVLHPDIRVYEVLDGKTKKTIGFLHVDMFARAGTKGGGAWMNQMQGPEGDKPNVVGLNMNIAKPPAGKPALIGLSQYITLYHEMGHSLQGLLGTEVKYRTLQGTAAPADFTEFHSMVNERRATLKKNLAAHALHVDTGKPAPDSLIGALTGSEAHFRPRDLLRLVQNSLRDLAFHSIDPAAYKGDEALEQSVALKSPYAEHIRPYALTRFGHLFSYAHSGYAAGYVNYLIADEHAADGFEPFIKDPYGAEWAERLSALYRRGSGGDPAALYRRYRGRDATPDAMLKEAGIP